MVLVNNFSHIHVLHVLLSCVLNTVTVMITDENRTWMMNQWANAKQLNENINSRVCFSMYILPFNCHHIISSYAIYEYITANILNTNDRIIDVLCRTHEKRGHHLSFVLIPKQYIFHQPIWCVCLGNTFSQHCESPKQYTRQGACT